MSLSFYLRRMKKLFILLSPLLFLSCNRGDNAPENAAEISLSDSVQSVIELKKKDGKWLQICKNSRFEVLDVLTDKGTIPTLFTIESNEVRHPDSTLHANVYNIKARSLESGDILWNESLEAQEMEINSREIRTIQITEGTDEDRITLYSLETGKKITGFCYGGLEVMIPNTPARRYVGYTSLECAGHPLEEEQDGSLLGKLSFASHHKLIQELKIQVNRSAISSALPRRTPELRLVHMEGKNASIQEGQGLILTSAGKDYTSRDISDFSIRLTYYYGEQGASTIIEIPVENDRMDINRANYDRTFFRLTL